MLGIDFGTSNTVAVLRRADGRAESLLFDGAPQMPSAVFAAPDGTVLTGRDAVESGRLEPALVEYHPKRRIDEGALLLGSREIAAADLVAAVLDRVRLRCAETHGAPPRRVCVTHPANWGPTRRLMLHDAAEAAGLPAPVLVPEPVAAAAYFTGLLGREMAEGSGLVVYDLGAGTFDASVVRRRGTGFEVLATDGLADLGGLDFDGAVTERLRAVLGDEDRWDRLARPSTAAERRAWSTFREDVRLAKERLSRHSQADLFVPVHDRQLHLTREELESLARPMLLRTAKVVEAVVRASGLRAADLHGVFMVGGASRMPLAATVVHQETGMEPTVIDQLELVVAHGAMLGAATSPPAAPAAHSPQSPTTPPAFVYAPAYPAGPPTPAAAPPQTPPTPVPGPAAPERTGVRFPLRLSWVALILVLEAYLWTIMFDAAAFDAWPGYLVAVLYALMIPLLWVRRPAAFAALIASQISFPLGAVALRVLEGLV